MKIAIIGGGALGLMLAAKLNKDNDIYIFEKQNKLGQKLLASGNGKANILNIGANQNDYNDPIFMKEIFNQVKPKDILDYFHELGLYTKIDNEGRVYPYSESSQTVLDIILEKLKEVNINLNYEVKNIKYYNDKWHINDFNMSFDKLVLASGSKAGMIIKNQIKYNNYLCDMNLKYVDLTPSLVGLKTKEDFSSLEGLRIKTNVSLIYKDNLVRSEYGEVIFKKDGISGIVILNMSSYINHNDIKNYKLSFDLLPDMTIYNLDDYYKKYKSITGLVHNKLEKYIKNDYKKLKNFIITIDTTYDFTSAQVVRGGIDVNEVNENLQSKKYNNLYIGGELLNIDGKCGGYNLLFAFMSAMIIAKELNYGN